MISFSSPRQRNPVIDNEAEEDSFGRNFDSDYDDVTINYSPLKDLPPLRSASLFDVPQAKRRVVNFQ